MGTHKKCLGKVLVMSTHNVCFHPEIKENNNTVWLKKKTTDEYLDRLRNSKKFTIYNNGSLIIRLAGP